MRILWSVNTISPNIAKQLNISSSHSISWVEAMSQKIKNMKNVELAIAAPTGKKGEGLLFKKIDGITYYILPKNCTDKDIWNSIILKFNPDIIHAYGTEGKHNIGLLDSAENKVPVIISLQGLVSEYHKYYYAGMSKKEILINYTLGDILVRNGIFEKKKGFIKQSKIEKDILSRVKYVEGRSDWDRVYSKKINKDLQYYYCPRMIRSPFYDKQWNIDTCKKFSILVHQATYPIKGLHMVLDALSIIKEYYPNTTLYIAGNMNLDPKTMKQKLLYGGYVKFIKKKISQLNLKYNIKFTGYLSSEEMSKLLCKVHVCVIPSSIENAPNAIAEAMLVGTPLVSSFVGGSPDMLDYGKCGLLYRFEEPEMLADKVIQYFEDNNLCLSKSLAAYNLAHKRHNEQDLTLNLLKIYDNVIKNEGLKETPVIQENKKDIFI